MRLRSSNRKLPPLPSPHELPKDDRRQWAILFTSARIRKRWTYLTLATYAGLSVPATVKACTKGTCSGLTALKLAAVLDVALTIPVPLTAQEALHGRQ